jgi:hypothetical protein
MRMDRPVEGGYRLTFSSHGGDHFYFNLWSSGKKKALEVGSPSSVDFIYFWGSNKKQQSCDGREGGGAQRHVRSGHEPKKTGAWARTARPKPTSLSYI